MIKFEDFFKLEHPEKTKVKFNMRDGKNGPPVYDYLVKNEDDAIFDDWIKVNAHREQQVSNNCDKAEYLLSFAQYYPYGSQFYVFGGLYKVEKLAGNIYGTTGYKLTLQEEYKEYRKRLIIKLETPVGRNAYLRWFENVQSQLNPEVYEITPSLAMEDFPGYANFCIDHKLLQKIYNNEAKSWKEALSCVKGVYCITDTKTGQLYIGSASGDNEGIWQRWQRYANVKDLTGGNKTFEDIKNNGADYIIDKFTYSILEIFDMRTQRDYIIKREEYWKKVFKSVEFGMNNNARKK